MGAASLWCMMTNEQQVTAIAKALAKTWSHCKSSFEVAPFHIVEAGEVLETLHGLGVQLVFKDPQRDN